MTISNEELLKKINFIFKSKLNTIDQAFELVERETEDKIANLLPSLGIRASIKTDRKSLRVNKSVSRKMRFITSFNDGFDTEVLLRVFLRELLENGCLKIRYYVDIVPVYKDDDVYAFEYTINWFEHKL